MNNAIIFLSIIIILFSIMLSIKITSFLDLYKDELIVKVYIFNIRIIKLRISIWGLTYSINNNKKIKSINLNFLEEETYFIKQIKDNILKKLYYDKIYFVTNLGFGNAGNTTITSSVLNNFCCLIENMIKGNNKDTRFYYDNKCDFVKNSLQVYLELNVYFTIFDMIFAIIMSLYRRGKYAKQKWYR